MKSERAFYQLKTLLFIPTCNAGNNLTAVISAIKSQTYQPDVFLIIDSTSTDDTGAYLKAAGAHVHVISRRDFNHGGTRQLAINMIPDADIAIFLTQDAILADSEAIGKLVACFKEDKVGAAYGRQLPHHGAGPIEAHARYFNYPPINQIKTMNDASELGIKTVFISNSFAAYRRKALMSVGGFPTRTIMSEDSYVAAKMLLAGWEVAYCADAAVYHSHQYGFIEEFKRYFDIGVFHAREPWIRNNFGKTEGEGLRYVRSELRYLMDRRPLLIGSSLMRNVLKLAAYKLGSIEQHLPVWFKRRISMHHQYWEGS